MKAEELFKKHRRIGGMTHLPLKEYLEHYDFTKALAEYRESIIKMIDEMIRKANPIAEDYKTDIDYDEHLGYRQALTELKEKLT